MRLLVLLAAAGCAPLTTMPPPAAPGDGTGFGVAGGALAQVGATTTALPSEHVHGGLWGDLRVSQRTRVGLVLGASGRQDLWSGGAVVRYTPAPDAATQLTINAEAGLAWAGAGLTVHRELGPMRLYASPSVVLKGAPWVRLPVGMSATHEGWVLGGELGLTSSLAPADHPLGPRGIAYVGLAVGRRFAVRTPRANEAPN